MYKRQVLSTVGSINAALAGGRLDAGAGTMTVAGLSGNGVLSASAGTMHFQDAFTVGETTVSYTHLYDSDPAAEWQECMNKGKIIDVILKGEDHVSVH